MVVQPRCTYLFKHGLPELQLFTQRLAAVFKINAGQCFGLQLAFAHSISVLCLQDIYFLNNIELRSFERAPLLLQNDKLIIMGNKSSDMLNCRDKGDMN